MRVSNFEMEEMLKTLSNFLDRRDLIGYFAARNFRLIQNQLVEYQNFKDDLIRKYGEPQIDESGIDTGRFGINSESSNFKDFIKELSQIGIIEHDVEVNKLSFTEAIDKLSGNELLSIDWMFEE